MKMKKPFTALGLVLLVLILCGVAQCAWANVAFLPFPHLFNPRLEIQKSRLIPPTFPRAAKEKVPEYLTQIFASQAIARSA